MTCPILDQNFILCILMIGLIYGTDQIKTNEFIFRWLRSNLAFKSLPKLRAFFVSIATFLAPIFFQLVSKLQFIPQKTMFF